MENGELDSSGWCFRSHFERHHVNRTNKKKQADYENRLFKGGNLDKLSVSARVLVLCRS